MTTNLPAVIDREVATRLAEYRRVAAGAYARNTERALKANTAVFSAFCIEQRVQMLPADPQVVAAFVEAMAATRKPATVSQYVWAIARLHRATGLTDPTDTEVVSLTLKRIRRERGVRQKQATALGRELVDGMLAAAGTDLLGLRNRAMLSLAYDTLARRSELVAFDVTDVVVSETGDGSILIRRSKTDQEGEGQWRYVAADTIRLVLAWLAVAGISEGPLFRTVRNGAINGRLDPGDVSRIWKRMALAAGLNAEAISGHSTRVGGACDMLEIGCELAELMQAGGWKDAKMPARYTAKLAVRRGAAAKLAARQGRA